MTDRRVPLAIAITLVVLACAFHAQLRAWFAGPGAGGAAEIAGVTAPGGGDEAASGDVAYYTCAMHTSVHAHAPGTCPICAMPLHPVSKADLSRGVISVDEARQRALGVRTAQVVRQPMTLDLRAVGKLTYDESRLHDVVLRIGGYISDLRVDETGQAVRRGQPLFQLYSPELYAAEQDYLLARGSRAAMGSAARGDELVRAAETKLALLGLTRSQIAGIAKTGHPLEKITFTTPASGYVIEKDVVDGAAVHAGDRVFRIAALDKIWGEANVFEADLGKIAPGQAATVSLSYVPDRTFEGEVTFVYPYLDPTTRTGRVRIELPNAARALEPDMYANVTFHVALGDRLQIPVGSILYAGPRELVLVELGGGRIAPREVTIGAQSAGRAEVLSGLAEGETVVTSGNFLLAAESRIRGAAALWEGSDGGDTLPAKPATAAPVGKAAP
jgi:Cu(I)/Ag(I) efflux system membrane fusion protein